jgi:arylsulfatase A-like enzyme
MNNSDYMTDALTKEAMRYITNNRAERFFVYLSYTAPHEPLQTRKKYLNMDTDDDPTKRIYKSMIKGLDENIGELLDQLEQLNLINNTIIVFLSDNGGYFGQTMPPVSVFHATLRVV